jgi:hypothetical protein
MLILSELRTKGIKSLGIASVKRGIQFIVMLITGYFGYVQAEVIIRLLGYKVPKEAVMLTFVIGCCWGIVSIAAARVYRTKRNNTVI